MAKEGNLKVKYSKDQVTNWRKEYYEDGKKVGSISKEVEIPYSSLSDIIHFKNQFSLNDLKKFYNSNKMNEKRKELIMKKWGDKFDLSFM